MVEQGRFRLELLEFEVKPFRQSSILVGIEQLAPVEKNTVYGNTLKQQYHKPLDRLNLKEKVGR